MYVFWILVFVLSHIIQHFIAIGFACSRFIKQHGEAMPRSMCSQRCPPGNEPLRHARCQCGSCIPWFAAPSPLADFVIIQRLDALDFGIEMSEELVGVLCLEAPVNCSF